MRFRHLFTVAPLAFITACGGGGGSNANQLQYSGKTTSVELSSSNANQLSLSVLDLVSTAELNLIGITTSSTPPLITITQNLVDHMVAVDSDFLQMSLPGVAVNETTPCETSGTVGANLDVNANSGAFTGTFSFNNCNESGDILNGKASVSGQFDGEGNVVGTFVLRTDRLTYSDGTGYEASLAGDLECTFGSYPAPDGTIIQNEMSGSCIQNIIAVESQTQTSFKLEDFLTIDIRVAFNDGGFGHVVVQKGRFYHSDYGYVDVRSTDPTTNGHSVMLYIEGFVNPIDGELVLVGRNNSRSQLVANVDGATYTLNIDADGDGSFETSSTEVW